MLRSGCSTCWASGSPTIGAPQTARRRARSRSRRRPRRGLLRLGASSAAACASAAARPGRITSASKRPAWPCPARRGRLRALCVVPIGMEEGTETDVPSDEIGLVVGEPAHFRFFSSSVRKHDQPGDLLSAWTPDELAETDSLEATLLPPTSAVGRLRAGPLPLADHGAGRVGAVVREHERQRALEAGVQRAGRVSLCY